jgi:hypothetical protein
VKEAFNALCFDAERIACRRPLHQVDAKDEEKWERLSRPEPVRRPVSDLHRRLRVVVDLVPAKLGRRLLIALQSVEQKMGEVRGGSRVLLKKSPRAAAARHRAEVLVVGRPPIGES